MASPTQWTWVWVNSGSWWWTRRPGVLQSMGSQRVGHKLDNWTRVTSKLNNNESAGEGWNLLVGEAWEWGSRCLGIVCELFVISPAKCACQTFYLVWVWVFLGRESEEVEVQAVHGSSHCAPWERATGGSHYESFSPKCLIPFLSVTSMLHPAHQAFLADEVRGLLCGSSGLSPAHVELSFSS